MAIEKLQSRELAAAASNKEVSKLLEGAASAFVKALKAAGVGVALKKQGSNPVQLSLQGLTISNDDLVKTATPIAKKLGFKFVKAKYDLAYFVKRVDIGESNGARWFADFNFVVPKPGNNVEPHFYYRVDFK